MLAFARLAGVLPIAVALTLDGGDAHAALAQAWPPFVLVAGLLLVGREAGADGLFDAAAARLAGLPGPPALLLCACLGLVAAVTAVLNLDTAAVFLTPVLIQAARRRGVDGAPFLYGSVFMANASSLFLPGSNLTNLLVVSGHAPSGATFLARMLPLAVIATLSTAAGLIAMHRRALFAGGRRVSAPRRPTHRACPGAGLWGSLLAGALIVALRDAALPVLAVGLVLTALRAGADRGNWRAALSWLGVPALASLFGVAVALGTVARASAFPADALHSAGALTTAAVAAGASVLVNNLPAAVLLSSRGQLPAKALLLGLNVGPNLAVSGSLAVLLWWRAARATGARPSALAYSRQGVALVALVAVVAVACGAI